MTICFLSFPFGSFLSKEQQYPLLITQNCINLVAPIFQAYQNADLRSQKNAALYGLNSIRIFQNTPKIDSLCKLGQFAIKKEAVLVFTETLMLTSHFVKDRVISLTIKTASSSIKALYLFSLIPQKFSKIKTEEGGSDLWNAFTFVYSVSSALEEVGKTYETLRSF